MGVSSLFGDLDVDATPDAPLGPMTWYGIGGRADLLIRPRSVESLATLVKRCARTATPLRVLGSGANLLVADSGVDGIVVHLDQPAFREVRFNQDGEINAMRAMAGADLAKTLMESVRRGVGGLTHMAGIPASIGGAIRMNAGGKYGTIGEAVRSVTCITKAGEIVSYPAEELRFEYRSTNIPDPVIVAATFTMHEGDPIRLREEVKEIFAYKKTTQPLADSSAGCTFRNPFDPTTEKTVSAGKLIEEAGLKGEAIGGASVSERHANFIVTQPGTPTDDVLRLLDRIEAKVFETSGLELQREIVIWKRGESDASRIDPHADDE